MALEDEAGSDTQDGIDRRMDRRTALRKAATGAAVAGVAWSAPSVKGLTLVPDYASAGTVTGLTRTFRILGVERNYRALDSGTDKHDFRGLNTIGVTASGGAGSGGYTPATAQALETGPAVTMTSPLGVAGSVTATLQNDAPRSFFRADAGSQSSPGSSNEARHFTAPERIQIPVTFNVDPPFNQCKVESGTLFHSNVTNGGPGDFWDLGSTFASPTGAYPNPLPETYPAPVAPRATAIAASVGSAPALGPHGAPFMNITPATTPNNPGTFTQTITVENRYDPDTTKSVDRILEIRFVVTC